MKNQALAYLKRIAYTGDTKPCAQLLCRLQEQHFYTVAYENLDILLGKPLSMRRDDLFHKIVKQGRGGYCFELNGLYGWLLRDLGFSVTDYMARFLLGEAEIPMRRHRVLVATLPDGSAYLCDVGVGIEVPRRAILLQEGLEQTQNGHIYCMEKDSFFGWILTERHQGTWRRVYSFTTEVQLDIDFIMPSFYCERHPDSIFNKNAMLSIKNPNGRVTLDGNILRIFADSAMNETTLSSSAQLQKALLDYFYIALPEEDCAQILQHAE